MLEQRDASDLLAKNEHPLEDLLVVSQRYFADLGKNTDVSIKSRTSIASDDSNGTVKVRDIFSIENADKDKMRVVCNYHFKRDDTGIMGELGAYWVREIKPIAVKWDKRH